MSPPRHDGNLILNKNRSQMYSETVLLNKNHIKVFLCAAIQVGSAYFQTARLGSFGMGFQIEI